MFHCSDNGRCRGKDGTCTCFEDWTGANGSVQVCYALYYYWYHTESLNGPLCGEKLWNGKRNEGKPGEERTRTGDSEKLKRRSGDVLKK